MRLINYIFSTALLCASIGEGQVSDSTVAKDVKSATVSATQFGRSNVIGHLNYPLGTVVRITGVCIDGERTRRKSDVGETLLEVRAVNGKQLQIPFVVPFGRAAKNISKPRDGDAFDYYAHEWGQFDGVVAIPEELGIEKPLFANDGFHYRPQITIYKSNAVDEALPLQRRRTSE